MVLAQYDLYLVPSSLSVLTQSGFYPVLVLCGVDTM